jgi:predicted PurR-regulated permease PerM
MGGFETTSERRIQDRSFLLLLALASLAFAWIVWPLFGAVLWGVIIAILFRPLYRRLVRALRQRHNLAALATVGVFVVMVLLPLSLLAVSLARETASVVAKFESGELSPSRYFAQIQQILPSWATMLLDRLGLSDFPAAREKLSEGLRQGSQVVAAQALRVGQSTFDFVVSLFVMVYLLFFLLRDGEALSRRFRSALPLRGEHKQALFEAFTVVVRATVKGSLVVAALQGALGGLIFWLLGIHAPLLWAVLMAVLSLLPAVGSALVWLPVALYLVSTGAVWQGVVLVAYGVLVIGLVDNFLRPILVGQDARMPDYLVLVSTLGGIAVLGVNGVVVGPLIAALFIAAWGIFSAARREAAG